MSPLRLFYSYSHRDENYRNELAKHLRLLERKGVLTCWHDRRISPGDEWKGQIDENLKNADIILLLVSPDFIASDYCYDIELEHAMQSHSIGKARVIPVIIRAVNWHDTPFGILQALPSDGRPVSTWDNQDIAWTDVEKGIRAVIHEITQSINARQSILAEPSKREAVSDFSDSEQRVASNKQARALTDTKTREIELTIDIDFDKYTDQDKEQLLNAIASLLKIKDSELKIKKIRRGSIKITLEMSAELAELLYEAVKAGGLKQLGVTNVELKDHAALHDASVSPEELFKEDIDELFVNTYNELRRLAHHYMRREWPDNQFSPTELINETYIRFKDRQSRVTFQNRFHFFAIAATIMRRILIDYSRQRMRLKRGGTRVGIIDLEETVLSGDRSPELLALDEALKRLATIDSRKSRIVELRYFGGLSNSEVAEILGLSKSTVAYEWSFAKAWLKRELATLE